MEYKQAICYCYLLFLYRIESKFSKAGWRSIMEWDGMEWKGSEWEWEWVNQISFIIIIIIIIIIITIIIVVFLLSLCLKCLLRCVEVIYPFVFFFFLLFLLFAACVVCCLCSSMHAINIPPKTSIKILFFYLLVMEWNGMERNVNLS
jgi:ABC-type multidrug transport system permease subunit